MNDDRKPDTAAGMHYEGSSRTDRIFSIVTSPDRLLTARPFANIDSMASCDVHEQHCRPTQAPLIYEIALKRTATSPALLVTLGHDSRSGGDIAIPLVRPQGAAAPSNYLSLEDGSTILLDDVTYYIDGHYVQGTLTTLDLRLRQSSISTGDLVLRLAHGSRLQIERLQFIHDGAVGQDSVTAEHAFLEAGLTAGSRIQIAAASTASPDAESYLALRDGSLVQLRDLSFKQDDHGRTSISWSNNSHQRLLVASGLINLGRGSRVTLASTNVDMNLAGTWEVGRAPRVSAADVAIDAQVQGGELAINSASTLRLGAGSLKADHLAIDSTAQPIVRGAFSAFSVDILPDTIVAFPGSIALITTAQGRVWLDPSGSGIQLGLGHDYPQGRYLIDVAFRTLHNAAAKTFELQDGHAQLPVEVLDDGTIQNPRLPQTQPWQITGNLVVAPEGGGNLVIASAITGSFQFTRASGPSFEGSFSGTGKAGFAWPIVTPAKGLRGQPPEENDLRVYPVSLSLATDRDFAIATTPFVIAGNGRVTTSVALDIPFVIAIPGGNGEHSHAEDAGSADGTHGPDKQHGWQEVAQVKKGCTMHMYIAPGAQPGGMKADLTIDPAGLAFDINEFHLDHEPLQDDRDYHRDGCDPSLIGTILGIVLGGAPGGVLGYVFGHKVNDLIDDLIRERIGQAIHGFHTRWRIQFR